MNTDVALTSLHAGRSEEHIPYQDALEAYQRNSNWWTVFAAFDLPDFSPSPIWLSQKTGLPIEEVVEALEGLTVLGFLKKDGGAFYPIKGKNFVKFDVHGRSKADVLDQHALISQQILNHLIPSARVAIDHRCISANREIVTELYTEISAAFDRAFEKSQAAKQQNDGVFKITFTAVDVLAQNQPNGKGR